MQDINSYIDYYLKTMSVSVYGSPIWFNLHYKEELCQFLLSQSDVCLYLFRFFFNVILHFGTNTFISVLISCFSSYLFLSYRNSCLNLFDLRMRVEPLSTWPFLYWLNPASLGGRNLQNITSGNFFFFSVLPDYKGRKILQ